MIVCPNIAHALHLATKPTPCTTGQVHLLVFYYIKLKSHLSACPSAFSWRCGSQPWLHGSTSDLLEMIVMSSDVTKFILKRALVFRQESAMDTCVDPDSHLPQQSSAQLVALWTLTP